MADITGLSDELFASACEFAESGLRARSRDQPNVYLLHIGICLELLFKAYLASLHGTLIVENDFDSLLRASGNARHARTGPEGMRTIGMGEARKRVGRLLPQIENLKCPLELLANVRNSISHMGIATRDVDNRFLLPFLQAGDLVVAAIKTKARADLWGDYLEMVDAYLAESEEAIKAETVEAIVVARHTFETRYGDMESAVRDGVIKAIEAGYEPQKYEQDLIDCPACGHTALATGANRVDWEADWDVEGGEGYISGVYPTVTFIPGTVECRVCRLVLDPEDAVQAAGVPESWQFEDVDPEDFYVDLEDDDYR